MDSSANETGHKKPPLLLLHGFPTSSWDFHRVWPILASHYRLIAPDFLGFGFSQKPRPHRYTIHEQADLIEGLAAALSLETCHLLAHDYGDTVAQELLARDNERSPECRYFRSLCLLNGGLFPETHRPLRIQTLLTGPCGSLIAKLITKRRFGNRFSTIFGPGTRPTKDDIDAFWSIITANGGRHVFSSLIGYMDERRLNRSRWLNALVKCHCPVQLINGSYDPISGSHMVARYREIVRNTDNIVELSDIGHYPQLEAPSLVSDHYLRFLDTLETADRGTA